MRQNIEGFIIKQNDTLPYLKISVKTRDCLDSLIPFCLTGATAVTFSMSDDSGNIKISSAPAEIIYTSGDTMQYNSIQYAWLPGDTSNYGLYTGEFELFFSDGNTMTIPTLDSIKINIIKSINGA